MMLVYVLKNDWNKIFVFAVNSTANAEHVATLVEKVLNEPVIELPLEAPKPKPAAAVSVNPKSQSCVICMDKPADHVIIPCGHQCGCGPCLTQLQGTHSPHCPICR